MTNLKKLQEIAIDGTTDYKKFRQEMKETLPQRRYNARIAIRLLQFIDDNPKMNKSQLAAKLHVSSAYLSKIFNGKANLSLDTIEKYEHLLGTNLLFPDTFYSYTKETNAAKGSCFPIETGLIKKTFKIKLNNNCSNNKTHKNGKYHFTAFSY